jgi:hypothetical protein
MSDAGTNGGRMTHTAIASAVKNNIWPDVPQSERTAGSTKYRKVFIHAANDDDLTLVQARLFVETYTPGDDSVQIFLGTQTNTQSSITGSERVYGCGKLNTNASSGASSIAVLTEGAAFNMFRNGDLIRVSDKATVDGAGNEQFVTINGVPSYGGDVATISITPVLAYNFLAADTRVASVIEVGDVEAAYSSFVVTSSAGTYNDTTYPILVDHIGGIQQNWTLTFSNASTFTLTGDTLGSLGAFTTASDLQPTNGNFSKPYFVMDNAGFGGTFVNGDTITFTTAPASIPVWYKRVVPAGASSLSANKVIVAIDGQSS